MRSLTVPAFLVLVAGCAEPGGTPAVPTWGPEASVADSGAGSDAWIPPPDGAHYPDSSAPRDTAAPETYPPDPGPEDDGGPDFEVDAGSGSCVDLLDCIYADDGCNRYPSDDDFYACYAECEDAGTSTGVSELEAYVSCWIDCDDDACRYRECADEQAGCLYDRTGSAGCSDTAACIQGCGNDAACFDACLERATRATQNQLAAYHMCQNAACPDGGSSCYAAAAESTCSAYRCAPPVCQPQCSGRCAGDGDGCGGMCTRDDGDCGPPCPSVTFTLWNGMPDLTLYSAACGILVTESSWLSGCDSKGECGVVGQFQSLQQVVPYGESETVSGTCCYIEPTGCFPMHSTCTFPDGGGTFPCTCSSWSRTLVADTCGGEEIVVCQ